jgi:hypothetical protein
MTIWLSFKPVILAKFLTGGNRYSFAKALVAEAEGGNAHRRQDTTIRVGEAGKGRRSPQAVACRKRGVEARGRPQPCLPWKTSVYGLQRLRHGRGNADPDQCWSRRPAVAHAQAGGGVL